MADFNLFGQTITDVNGFRFVDTIDNEHTFIESLIGVQIEFTVIHGSGAITSVTCNKTFAEIVESADSLKPIAVVKDPAFSTGLVALLYEPGDERLIFVVYNMIKSYPIYGIELLASGGCNVIDPPPNVGQLNVTANGTYNPTYPNLFNEVTVNVPSTTISPLSVTANGTYTAPSGTAYSPVTVNVSGGGGDSAWTKVAETTYQVSTTSTATTTIETWSTGKSELWTSSKWVYVRVRDTAGKRNGYFYGCDTFFYNTLIASGSSKVSITTTLMDTIRYSNGTFTGYATAGAGGYGVYADTLYSDGRIRMRQRYNSGITLTVDGTYKVEVYLLNTPDGVPIFN